MGHGYKGDTGHHHSITENLGSLTAKYDYSNGYFGEQGKGRSFVRNISSDDPASTAKDFYDTAAHGGIEGAMDNGKGYVTKMKDGTILSYRDDHGDIKYQKIHFVKGE